MPVVGKWFIPNVPKAAMGFVISRAFATNTERSTDMPSNRDVWQKLVMKRSRGLFNLFGRQRFRSSDLLRLSIGKSAALDGPGIQA